MPSGALGTISKISSKFFHEVMPVVLASVIGTILVNHYSRQPISPPVVVQATPPASAEATFQTLRDEQVLIADYLRRDANAKREADAARDRGPSAPPAVEDRPNKVRPVSAEKAAPRPPAKPQSEKTIAARDPAPPQPAPVVVALPAPAEPAEAPAAKHAGVVGTVRDWIVNASGAPARALAPRLFSDPPTPPMPVPVSGPQLAHEN
jgi:hypothetical protein